MKNHYCTMQRWNRMLWMTILLALIMAQLGYAQSKKNVQQGVVRIKVTEELAVQIESARLTRDANNVVLTGISSLDNVNRQFKANGIQRVFRDGGKYEARHRQYGLHLWYEIKMDKASAVLSALSAYKAIPQVKISEPIYEKAIIGADSKNYGPVVYNPAVHGSSPTPLTGPSNDPLVGAQWHYNNTGQTGGTVGADISLFEAWGIETGNSNVVVAITDGGVQFTHPDIAANMWVNTGEVPGNGVDDDGNGYIDDIHGYGFGDNTGNVAPDDHATHVAGTIAAVTNNGVGVAGIAGGTGSGNGVRIMTCAAFGATGTGGFENTYVYGADNGAVISQNSWGYTNPGVFEQAVLDAIDYFIATAGTDGEGNQTGPMKGGIVIFAAGNDNTNAQHYPGFYEPTFAVAATNHKDQKAWYSNFGPWVEVAAPGGETNSVPQQGVLSTLKNNQYGFFQGTSMACPHVSGLAALIVSHFGGAGLTPSMVKARISQTTDNIDAVNPSFVGMLGVGRINAFAALQENDNVAPNAIADLQAVNPQISAITLKWTAPSDPGSGAASFYDIRYSTSPITTANFASATAIGNPPSPTVPGTTQQLNVTGLTPGTTYYFAIKSSDFFGNTSNISNIASATTFFAPILEFKPTSLDLTVQTNQYSSVPFVMYNRGEGPLSFYFKDYGTGLRHTSPSVRHGVIAGHDSLVMQIDFNGRLIAPGTYNGDLYLTTNDPLRDSVTVPITLHVVSNGQPVAYFIDTPIDFMQVFQGYSKTINMQVRNDGAEPLKIFSATSNNPAFTVALDSTITIPAIEIRTIPVTFHASTLGQQWGSLYFATNDPDQDTVQVDVYAESVVAPFISATPDSLYEQLNTNKTSTKTLTVHNDGGSDLNYTVNVTAKLNGVSVSTTKQIDLPARGASLTSSSQKHVVTTARVPQKMNIKSVGKSAIVHRVIIITPDTDVSDFEAMLDAFDDIEADVYPHDELATFSADAIEGYDVALTTNNTQWLAAGGVDPKLIGDELASYIDVFGGKVISSEFNYSYDAWKLQGRFITEQYGPFVPSTSDELTSTTLGTITAPSSVIMEGVNTVSFTGFVQNVGLAPGATSIATWDNGELFIAANSNVVALNFLPSLGDGGALQWEGDIPLIYQNAIHYLAGPGFVDITPTEGTITAGSQADFEVKFDAGGLETGLYNASIDFHSNAPNAPLFSVPTTLKVLGPEFTVTPDSLSAEVERGGTTTKTFTLNNNGQGDFAYDISVQSKGVTAVDVKKISNAPKTTARRAATETRTARPTNARMKVDLHSTQPLTPGSVTGRNNIHASTLSVDQYATDFESLILGDINGQDGWNGQFGNWTVENVNPASGSQHFRGTSDGFGLSLAFSPMVLIGTEEKSTTTMMINMQDIGVTWQVIPQSPSAGFVNTRVQFSPDGTGQVLVSDGAGGFFYDNISKPTPLGYFELTIELDRATSALKLYYDGVEVYSGLGLAGDIEQVVFLSLMEEAGPTFDMDDFHIIDGKKEFTPQYITTSPSSGNLGAGESVEVTVTFDASKLEFGTYSADLNINIGGAAKLVVPTSLRVFGDPSIQVDPTVVQAQVPYKKSTTKVFDITNTGGNPLEYSMQVIGANTDVAKLPPGPKSKYANWKADQKITDKVAKDKLRSKASAPEKKSLEVRTGTSIFAESFESESFPPSDWKIVDNTSSGVAWNFAGAWGEGNYSGTGEAATVSSDAAGEAEFDTELISPWVNTTGYKHIAVQYNVNYQNFANLDFLDVDIQVAGDSSWTNVLRWNEDHGTFRGTPGEFVSLMLDDYLGSASSFRLRWHYYDPNTGDFDWYAQIDDVVVLGDARAWLSVSPASGTVPVRGSETITALFESDDLNPGFYVAGILVSSNAVNTPLVGVVASLDVMNPAVISVAPDDLKQKLFVGESATQTLTISNDGESPLEFSFEGIATAGAPSVAKARVPSSNVRHTPFSNETRRDERLALTGSSATKLAGSALYATGFEEFATGDIDGQEGWAGQFSNWTVESMSPFSGVQHFRGLADGLGQSLAFSPQVAIGSDAISSTTMKVNITGTGVTWQVIPQSPTAGFVDTRFEISPDGSMRTLIDSLGGIYVPVPGTWPAGYNDLRLDFVRATKQFTIYINNAAVFTGRGFAGDIEQVVILSLMEDGGPTMDVDNFAILDGTPSAPWLTVSPLSGVVPSGSSQEVTVTFSAADLEAGWYSDTLNIASNDPAAPWTFVPVALTVESNIPPVLADIPATTVLEKQIYDITFTATDADDSLVTVTLVDVPSFITPLTHGNGFASYRIKPTLGSAGRYDLAVMAQDARGAMDIDTLHLEVIKFAVASFSVVNVTTGEVVAEFTDHITLNRATPGFDKLNIRANTTPGIVGSVKFKINGHQQNIDNAAPYLLKTNLLAGMGVGSYALLAEPYSEVTGHGQKGVGKEATITIINATTVVTDFSLVNTTTGEVLQNFSDSVVIDASRWDFNSLNIRANTSPSTVGSVKFKIDGHQQNIDNAVPYLLKTRALQTLASGTYALLGEPYTETFGHGQRGLGKAATLIVMNGASDARLAIRDQAENSNDMTNVSLYPVPVTDVLTISIDGKRIEGDVDVAIITVLGQVLHKVKVSADKIHGYQISTSSIGMGNGVYYLKLQSSNGLRDIKKFTKN